MASSQKNLATSSEMEIDLGLEVDEEAGRTSSDSYGDSLDTRESSLDLENDLSKGKVDLGKSRYVILAIALICSVWSAGLIFGWAPLYGTLLRAGIYANLCPPTATGETTTSNLSITGSPLPPGVHIYSAVASSSQERRSSLSGNQTLSGDTPLCDAQEKRLNLIYTAGSALTQASLFLSGIVLDWKGPKLTATLSALVVTLGSFLFGLASLLHVDLYIVGFALMGFGGAGINLATYTVSNLFPQRKSWVVSSLVGVWTLSSLWFLIFRPAFNSGIPLYALFFGQSILLFVTAIIFFFTFPSRALRDGEIFSFRQWLPWNAQSHQQHHAVNTEDHDKDIPLQTFHASSEDDAQDRENIKARSTSSSPLNLLDESPKNASPLLQLSKSAQDLPSTSSLQTYDDFHLNFGQFNVPSRPSLERVRGSRSDLSKSSQSLHGSMELASSSATRDLPVVKVRSLSKSTQSLQRSRTSFKRSGMDVVDLDTALKSEDGQEKPAKVPARQRHVSGGLAMAKAVLADVLTVDFALLTIWFAIHVLFFEFFIGTIADALTYRTRQANYPFGPPILSTLGKAQTVDTYVMTFNLIYAVGFVFVPVYAWSTDKLGFTGSFFLATFFAFAYPFVAMAPWLPSQFFGYVIYSAAIQFVYSCQFGFIAYRFGYQHFGVLVGLMGIVAACLIPLQPVFLSLVLNKFNGNFFWMYLMQGLLTLPLFGIVIWNAVSTRRQAAAQASEPKL